MSTRLPKARHQHQRRPHLGGHRHPDARTARANTFAISKTSATSKTANTNMRSSGHPRSPYLTNTSFFATTPTLQLLGFSTTAQAIATNAAVAGGVQRPEPHFVHSAMFEEVMRPLLPRQNLFESVDPGRESKRFENILGGWVRNPGDEIQGKSNGERVGGGMQGSEKTEGEGRKKDGQEKKRLRKAYFRGRGGGGGGGGERGGRASGRGRRGRGGAR